MLDSIADAIAAVRQGKMIVVVDDEDRENEGDLICAAEKVTPEMVNFMATEGRGLICAALPDERCVELDLPMMVGRNTALHDTPFTVSVDLLAEDTSTGISASDRAKTLRALADPATRPDQLARPGHIFPLRARKGGVLRRTGHTEAAMDFARLAGLQPAGVLVEILNTDGTMARLPQLRTFADRHGLLLVSIRELIEYRLQQETLIERIGEYPAPNGAALFAYRQQSNGDVHLAVKVGDWSEEDEVLVRVHAAGLGTWGADAFTLQKPSNLVPAWNRLFQEGQGLLLFMNQSPVAANHEEPAEFFRRDQLKESLGYTMDQRDFGVGAQILRHLGIKKLRLLSNSPQRRVGIKGYGLEIVNHVQL